MERVADMRGIPLGILVYDFPAGVSLLSILWCWLVHTMTVRPDSIDLNATSTTCFPLCERIIESTIDCSARNLTSVSMALMPGAELQQLERTSHRPEDVARTRERSGNHSVRDGYLLNRSTMLDPPPGGEFCAVSVMVLNLQNNLIQALDSDGFPAFPDLRRLNLSGNTISYLPNGSFSQLTSLLYLDISENNVSFIQPYAFQGLQHLQELNLKGNRLLVLDTRWVAPLGGLVRLNMAECNVKSIPEGFVTALASLTFVDLSYNRIDVLHVGELSNLSMLELLALEGNPLRCDCRIVPLHSWLKDNATRTRLVNTNSSCASPESLAHQALLEVPVGRLKCRKEFIRVSTNPDLYTTSTLLPYDPMMGVWTAATLSGMLVLFLLCVVLDKIKRSFKRWWRRRKEKEEQYRYSTCGSDSQYKLHIFADDLIETLVQDAVQPQTKLSQSYGGDMEESKQCTPIPPTIFTEDYSSREMHVGLGSDDIYPTLSQTPHICVETHL